jgi:hypothetical protein
MSLHIAQQFPILQFHTTIEQLEDKYDNINTRCKYISIILSLLHQQSPINTSLVHQYNTYLHTLKTLLNNKELPAFDNTLQLEKLQQIWTLSPDTNPKHKLITGLYLFIQPLRSDYAGSYILNNQIHVKLIKVNKGQTRIIDIPTQLLPYINIYHTLPSNNNSFVQLLSYASKKIFDKYLSINSYRHIWAEYGKRTLSIENQQILASSMNHSFNIHNSNYLPKQHIQYDNTITLNNTEIYEFFKNKSDDFIQNTILDYIHTPLYSINHKIKQLNRIKTHSNIYNTIVQDIQSTNERLHYILQNYKMNSIKTQTENVQIPEIQLSKILDIISRLQVKTHKTYVYILICEDSKFFVGFTTLEIKNLLKTQQFFSNWTCIYKYISLLAYFPGNIDDANNITLLMTKCVGENNVRGGKWNDFKNVTFDQKSIQEITQELFSS